MHAKLVNGVWVQTTPEEIRATHPNKIIPDLQLAGHGLQSVTIDERPEVAPGQVADGALVDRDGAPAWEWTIRPMTAAELQDARAGASLTKTEFLLRAAAAGLLSQADAKLAAQGELPAAFAAVIAAMPQADRDRAEIIWPAATRIERLDPLIGAVAAGMSISEETLDALFGLTPTL